MKIKHLVASMAFVCILMGSVSMNNLPDYVSINDENADETLRNQLITPSEEVSFPLSENDCKVINTVEAKFDQEENMAGLAAPQIGFHKQVIVFAVPEDPILKKFRPDLTDTMPKTIWLNPSYEVVGEETTTDYEACFSVEDLVGPVTRSTTVNYTAYDQEGNKITGKASGFLARVIQHEIDHVHGKLFIDKVPKYEIDTIEEYRAKRAKDMQ